MSEKSVTQSGEIKVGKKRPVEKREYSEKEIQDLINDAVAKALEQNAPKIIVQSNDEMVTLLYLGAVAEGSMVNLGEKIGEIQGRGGMLEVPKKVFLQNRTQAVLKRLKDRRLIVINGLTDAERKMYGLNYAEGELVDQNIYYTLLDMQPDQVVSIFERACYKHKQLIASLYIDAYNKNDNRINQPLIQRLNKVSKNTDKEGMFTPILKDMARTLVDDE